MLMAMPAGRSFRKRETGQVVPEVQRSPPYLLMELEEEDTSDSTAQSHFGHMDINEPQRNAAPGEASRSWACLTAVIPFRLRNLKKAGEGNRCPLVVKPDHELRATDRKAWFVRKKDIDVLGQ